MICSHIIRKYEIRNTFFLTFIICIRTLFQTNLGDILGHSTLIINYTSRPGPTPQLSPRLVLRVPVLGRGTFHLGCAGQPFPPQACVPLCLTLVMTSIASLGAAQVRLAEPEPVRRRRRQFFGAAKMRRRLWKRRLGHFKPDDLGRGLFRPGRARARKAQAPEHVMQRSVVREPA